MQPDQVRLRIAPIAFTGVAGGVVQVVPVSDTPVTLAAAAPVLARVKVTVNPWPALSVDGDVVSAVAVTAAGACTVTLALAVFDVTARAGLFASNPEADAERVTVPATAEEQFA